ncbi:hypothetical protein CC86DRAFT_469412 [Ophiobolus disseminans]|uniref:Transcription factor IIIC putative zinc-finger domain-containing protein n=1 Tax=Ophiobolus disseminans TaxID=1469910 RepID=A0A6A6ZPG8_9PLEO|nr:hypothetical protein CC86DRAFT_469412 [Ophiobolus disseminans]
MADVTELRCWPSCIDALDWSQDGIIALASDERVELLFPNTVTFDRDQDVAQWQHIPLQVPWFTNEELPTKEPAPLPNYSIGEEISSSAPIAIAWSPPGLAKHRRCALAALTANLVLSIWSADGKPKEGSSWDRRLIVNNALAEYFMSNATDESSHITPSLCEKMRLRTRIRAFAWAPALSNAVPLSTLGSRVSYGQHMVAVCNDDNQLALVVVDSPTSTYGTDRTWNAEVLTHVALTPDSESIFSQPSCFEDMMKQQKHISHVSWSPWLIRGDWYHSIIVYAINDDVRARVVTYSHDSVGLGDEVVYHNIEMRSSGPIKWSPTINDGVLTLALFSAAGLVYLKISSSDASIIEQTTHDLDGRWDPVTGAIWDTVQQLEPHLHFSSLLSTIQNPTVVLEATSTHLKTVDTPYWREQIQNSAVLFSAKNDLKGNTKMKVWGLATSPLGDFIATCHSVHPSDMIEYGSPNDRRGTVAVSALRRYRQIRQSFPARDVSAEGVIFTVKKLMENTVEDSDQLPAFVEEMVRKLVQTYGPVEVSVGSNEICSPTFDSDDLCVLVKEFKQTALLNSESLKDRYTVLASQACDSNSGNNLEKTLIAYRLATSLQGLPDTLCKTSFSTEIRAHHDHMISLIETLLALEDAEPEDAEDANKVVELELAASTVDKCDFCTAAIPFTGLKSASCTNGHQFPRCGLSFLAIQAPDITKYCGICSTPFLSEEFVMAQEMKDGPLSAEAHVKADEEMASQENITLVQVSVNGDEAEKVDDEIDDAVAEQERRKLPTTLARVLFLACDVCIYCGGKFVG